MSKLDENALLLAANTLRCLAADEVQAANSGHPGVALGLADVVACLWLRHLKVCGADPAWADRDRFVMSGGHASSLLYAVLHLAGFGLTLDDLRQFRQLGARTPGHPEFGVTPGVETTTGPLGQGIAAAVGMAVAERMLAARLNAEGRTVVDHRTWVTCGDGDLEEGISHEACSLAGALGLGKLTLLYDSNDISIEGPIGLAVADDTKRRFESYGGGPPHAHHLPHRHRQGLAQQGRHGGQPRRTVGARRAAPHQAGSGLRPGRLLRGARGRPCPL